MLNVCVNTLHLSGNVDALGAVVYAAVTSDAMVSLA